MDSFLSFLSRIGRQANRENESEDTPVERDTPEISHETDIQRSVLREQPVPTDLGEKSIQTAMPGNEANTEHIQPSVIVKQKASIETSDEESDVGPGEFVTLRQQRASRQQSEMIGTRTVFGARTGQPMTVPVLSEERKQQDFHQDGIQTHVPSLEQTSDMELTGCAGKILEVNGTEGCDKVDPQLSELQRMNDNQSEELARMLSQIGEINNEKRSMAQTLKKYKERIDLLVSASKPSKRQEMSGNRNDFDVRQTSAWAEVDTELFQPGKGRTFEPNSFSTPAGKHVQYTDLQDGYQGNHDSDASNFGERGLGRGQGRSSYRGGYRGGHRTSYNGRGYGQGERSRERDDDGGRQQQPRYESQLPSREVTDRTNVDSRRRRSASLYAQEIDDSAGALKLLDDTVRRKPWGKEPMSVLCTYFHYYLMFENSCV